MGSHTGSDAKNSHLQEWQFVLRPPQRHWLELSGSEGNSLASIDTELWPEPCPGRQDCMGQTAGSAQPVNRPFGEPESLGGEKGSERPAALL